MTRTRLILLATLSILLLAVPVVAAQTASEDVELRSHERLLPSIVATSTACATSNNIIEVPWPHSRDVVNGTYWLSMEIQVTLASGLNPREIEVEALVSEVGGPLSLNAFAFFRLGSSTDTVNVYSRTYSQPLTLEDPQPFNPISISVTQNTVTGGNPVVVCKVALTLHSLESIPMSMEISTAFDQWIPFVFWGILAILMFARVAFAPALVASIMFANNVLEEPVLSMQFGLLLFVIILILHVVAVNGFFPGFGKGREPT